MLKPAPMSPWNGGEGIAAKSASSILPRPEPTLSFIEPHEEQTAIDLIDEQFVQLTGKKFSTSAKPCGYMAVVKIYVRPEELKEITDANGKKQTLYLPDSARAEDKFQSCQGLVIAVGPSAHRKADGTPRYYGGVPYKVGDWVTFPRADIIRLDFRGVPVGVMTDDRALMVIEDPADWTPGHLSTKA